MSRSNRNRWLIFATTAILVISALATGGCAYFKEWQQLPASKADETTLFVVSHGWHTGIVLARDQLGPDLAFIPEQLGESAYYEFGWGDKAFYQTPGFDLGIAIAAFLWPTDSTMHVVAVPDPPAHYFPESESVELHVSRKGHAQLVTAIATSFAKNAEGQSLSTRDGLYGHSRFFDANGSYHAFNTCNTWTARTLGRAGIPTTTILTITAGSVTRQAKRAAKTYQCCSNDPASP